MTGRRSEALRADTYERLLVAAGLRSLEATEDEGGSLYFISMKR